MSSTDQPPALPTTIRDPLPSAIDSLPATLTRLYAHRFSTEDTASLREVWRVLVRQFFQPRLRPDATVVDIGAGECLFINEVRAARRIAVDANPAMAAKAAPGVETVITTDLELRELDGIGVDHAFLSNFLEHLPDYQTILRLLRRIHDVLEPGGTLLVLQPNFRLCSKVYFDFIDHLTLLTDASLVEALSVCGFEIVEKRVRFLPFTSKSRLPQKPWMVSLYLRIPPAQWLLGKQTFIVARRPPT